MFKQKQDLIIIVVTLIELLLSCYQVFCNDLIISNMAPKLNETITITALNVPNFTSINIDRAIGYDGDYGGQYYFNRFIEFTEQFILLTSQEIQQNANLKSIEFGFYSFGNVSIIFARIAECGGQNQQTCRDYLTNNPSVSNLTIVNMIESNQVTLYNGKNYITNDRLNINAVIEKGVVPIVRLASQSITIVTKETNDLYPDFVCLNQNTSAGDLIGLANFTNLKYSIGATKSNLAVQFKFDDTTLVNLTISYAFTSFGSYVPYLHTQYGGNFYETQNNQVIMIANIDQYPFQNALIQTFYLKCETMTTNVTCTLKSNITNYANSNQSILIDYGDGSSETIYINPYYVPVWIPSNSLTVNLAGFNNYGRYLLLLNNYVQNNGSVDGFEIYCTESREILLRFFSILNCLESQEACANYLDGLNGSKISDYSINTYTKVQCNKGYNYFNKTQIGNVSVIKGYVPIVSSAFVFISVDTSIGSKYSDYTFYLIPENIRFDNFRRINMNANFRFHIRIYYDYETQQNVFSRNYLSKPSSYVSATINLDNGVSQTAYGQVLPKSNYVYKRYSTSYFDNLPGVNMENVLIKRINYKSKTICFQACNLNVNCILVIFDSSTKICSLFSDYFNVLQMIQTPTENYVKI